MFDFAQERCTQARPAQAVGLIGGGAFLSGPLVPMPAAETALDASSEQRLNGALTHCPTVFAAASCAFSSVYGLQAEG